MGKELSIAVNIDIFIVKLFINTVRLDSIKGTHPPIGAFYRFLDHYKRRMANISMRYRKMSECLKQKMYAHGLAENYF